MAASIGRLDVRELPCGSGYVIDRFFPSGAEEQLIGVFVSAEHALRALRCYEQRGIEPNIRLAAQ